MASSTLEMSAPKMNLGSVAGDPVLAVVEVAAPPLAELPLAVPPVEAPPFGVLAVLLFALLDAEVAPPDALVLAAPLEVLPPPEVRASVDRGISAPPVWLLPVPLVALPAPPWAGELRGSGLLLPLDAPLVDNRDVLPPVCRSVLLEGPTVDALAAVPPSDPDEELG